LNGSTYFYTIRAWNDANESAEATETAAMSPQVAVGTPAAPQSLAAFPGNNQVTLTWTPSLSSGVVQQRVYRSTTAGVYTTSLPAGGNLSNTASSYTDTTAANGTTYFYVVRAYSTVESANSNQVSTTPVSGTLPVAPTNFTATAGDNLVSFSWTRSTSSGITQQRIYRSTTSGVYGAPGTQLITISDNVTQIAADLTASNGTPYFFIMRTWNGTAESPSSIEQGPVTPSVDAPPLPPTNLIGVSGNSLIFLSWTPSVTPGVTQQMVYRSLASGVYGAPLATIADNVTAVYTDSTPINGVPYFYVVRAAY
jgi:hypothetical protein